MRSYHQRDYTHRSLILINPHLLYLLFVACFWTFYLDLCFLIGNFQKFGLLESGLCFLAFLSCSLWSSDGRLCQIFVKILAVLLLHLKIVLNGFFFTFSNFIPAFFSFDSFHFSFLIFWLQLLAHHFLLKLYLSLYLLHFEIFTLMIPL